MPKKEFLTREEQRGLIYTIFGFPRNSTQRGIPAFVWQLLDVGCPTRYILRAYSALVESGKWEEVNRPNE